jgi:hypothetical protein
VIAGLDCAVVINFASGRSPSEPAPLTAITAVPAVNDNQEISYVSCSPTGKDRAEEGSPAATHEIEPLTAPRIRHVTTNHLREKRASSSSPSVWFIWFVLFIWLVSFNQKTRQTK